jgi:hypothetical protein
MRLEVGVVVCSALVVSGALARRRVGGVGAAVSAGRRRRACRSSFRGVACGQAAG